jgi:small nuclear ribonucleoprotein (snRNP)-like protein
MQLDPNLSFKDTLKQAIGGPGRVTLHLRNGQTFEGTVAGVEDHFVLLSGLAARDQNDAVIRIDDISAIEASVREG